MRGVVATVTGFAWRELLGPEERGQEGEGREVTPTRDLAGQAEFRGRAAPAQDRGEGRGDKKAKGPEWGGAARRRSEGHQQGPGKPARGGGEGGARNRNGQVEALAARGATLSCISARPCRRLCPQDIVVGRAARAAKKH